MLELCGSGYVIEYCISAFHKYREQEAFKNYIADGLYAIVNHSGSYSMRFSEFVHPKSEEEEKKEIEESKKQSKKIISNIRDKLQGG